MCIDYDSKNNYKCTELFSDWDWLMPVSMNLK